MDYLWDPPEEHTIASRPTRLREHFHVRQRNRKGSDSRLRRCRRDRLARNLLPDRDGRVAVPAVRSGGGLLRHVLGGLLLVDDIRTGTRPVEAYARLSHTSLGLAPLRFSELLTR